MNCFTGYFNTQLPKVWFEQTFCESTKFLFVMEVRGANNMVTDKIYLPTLSLLYIILYNL